MTRKPDSTSESRAISRHDQTKKFSHLHEGHSSCQFGTANNSVFMFVWPSVALVQLPMKSARSCQEHVFATGAPSFARSTLARVVMIALRESRNGSHTSSHNLFSAITNIIRTHDNYQPTNPRRTENIQGRYQEVALSSRPVSSVARNMLHHISHLHQRIDGIRAAPITTAPLAPTCSSGARAHVYCLGQPNHATRTR